MKKWTLVVAVMALLLSAVLPAAAQNKTDNPLGIDGTCYALYRETEKQLGKAGFVPAAELLRQAVADSAVI